jgi:hypothetical protein
VIEIEAAALGLETTPRAKGDPFTYAGDGLPGYNGDGLPATSTNLAFPVGVAVDASGTIYEVDEDQFRVRKIR